MNCYGVSVNLKNIPELDPSNYYYFNPEFDKKILKS